MQEEVIEERLVESNGKTPEAVVEDADESESIAPSAKAQKIDVKEQSLDQVSTNLASSENYNVYSGFSVFGL